MDWEEGGEGGEVVEGLLPVKMSQKPDMMEEMLGVCLRDREKAAVPGTNDAGHVMAVTRIHVVTSAQSPVNISFIRLDSIPEVTNGLITFPRKLFVQV